VTNLPLAVLRYTWRDYGPVTPGFEDAQFNELFASKDWPLGLARFWSDTTLGLLDCASGACVFPWRVLPLDQDLAPNPKTGQIESRHSRYEIRDVALDAADDDFKIEDFGAIVIFMRPAPSDAAALGPSESTTVLDWNGEQSYMAHELGHALSFEHAGGPDGADYGDPFCIMSYRSCLTYEQTVSSDPEVPASYYRRCGCMASAAHVYWTLGDFRASSSVVHLPADARDRGHSVTLKAFSEAVLGDPVLAVIEVDGETWTAEYRVRTHWDQGIGSNAVVFHKIRHPPAPKQTAVVLYAGVIRIPFERGIRDWQPLSPLTATDLSAVVERADDQSVTFSFHRKLDHAVTLAHEVIDLDHWRGPPARRTLPVRHGLCGDREFETYVSNKKQRLVASATPVGYVDPAFAWKVNGQTMSRSGPAQQLTITTTGYVDDGETVSSVANTSASVTWPGYARDEDKPADNLLWIENDPRDGVYDLTIEVEVRDRGPRPPSARTALVTEQVAGTQLIVDGKAEADKQCADYWRHLGERLPSETIVKRIDRGDPLWHALDNRPDRITGAERAEVLDLTALARALQATDPEAARPLVHALARRLDVDVSVIAHHL
jgi:hypothetical protein